MSGPVAEIELYCPECGYNQRGIDSPRCPECGLPIDRSTISISTIPWEHRRRIGWFKAFWRTVLMAMFRPGRLGMEVAKPVNYRAARLFQLITVLLAYLAFILSFGYILYENGGADLNNPQFLMGFAGSSPLGLPDSQGMAGIAILLGYFIPGVAFLLPLLFLWLVTGINSYFFHPRYLSTEQQNRAVAVSYYSCAAIVWQFIPLALMVLAVSIEKAGMEIPSVIVAYGASAICLVIQLFWWFSSIRLLMRSTQCGGGRTLFFALTMPVLSMLLGILIFIILPGVIGFVALVYASFH